MTVSVEALSETQLIALVRDGSTAALAELYRQHAGSLLRVTADITGSMDDAEDVVHDVFVGLPRALRRYQERGQFTAWLTRVAARAALMRLRRARRPGPPPSRVRSGADLRVELEDAIGMLPDSLRTVFVLREIVGYSYEEIGEALGIRPGAARVRYSRALFALRATLGGQ